MSAVVNLLCSLVAVVTPFALQGCGGGGSDGPPSPPPSPPPPAGEPRLKIVNKCDKEPIWIAYFSGLNDTWKGNHKIMPNEEKIYYIPDDLRSTRFWPKMYCDYTGQQCEIGDSGGPDQTCKVRQAQPGHAALGCAPPVDTKFEATFGIKGGDCYNNGKVCDWIDTSAVDGYTLPFKLEFSDRCKADSPLKKKVVDIDCSRLTLDSCPLHESLGPKYVDQSLEVHAPEDPGKIVGCYSPCAKLTSVQWANPTGNHTPESDIANPYCCPTPPVSSKTCRAGPAAKSNYAKVIHTQCPNVYSYSYDDGVGLQVCPPETTYTWTLFCPQEDERRGSVVL